MKKKLLYIRLLKEEGFYFGVPQQHSTEYSQIYDLDNFSNTDVVMSAVHFLKQENVKVILDCKPKAPINKLLHLFNAIREKENVDLEIIGEHQMLAYLKG